MNTRKMCRHYYGSTVEERECRKCSNNTPCPDNVNAKCEIVPRKAKLKGSVDTKALELAVQYIWEVGVTPPCKKLLCTQDDLNPEMGCLEDCRWALLRYFRKLAREKQ